MHSWQSLQFEYVDAPGVCEYTTQYAAIAAAHQHYLQIMQDESNDYLDFGLQMQSLLRYLPSSLIGKPLAVRSSEEALRIKVAILISNRPDLVCHYFAKGTLASADSDEMLRHLVEGTYIHVDTHSYPNRFENHSPQAKQLVVDLVNHLLEEPLLTPAITAEEFESLITTGNCTKTYSCNNYMQFSHILYMLAKLRFIPKRKYLKTVCQCNKLISPVEKGKPTLAITPKLLSSSHAAINADMDAYTIIERVLESIAVK